MDFQGWRMHMSAVSALSWPEYEQLEERGKGLSRSSSTSSSCLMSL